MKIYSNESPAFFIGAGASNIFGYPTTKEFMKLSNGKNFPPPYSHLIGFLNQRKGSENIDIEIVLGELQLVLETINSMDKDDTFLKYLFLEAGEYSNGHLYMDRDQLKKLIDDINRLVYDTYWETEDRDHRNIYYKLFSHFDRPLDIYTTNYDRIIERTFWQAEKVHNPFTDGFFFDGESLIWHEELLDNDYWIRLHKLHGSVNWKKGRSQRIVRVDEPFFTNHQEQVQIYPGWKGKPTASPFKEIHERLRKKLTDSKTKTCIVIGFSFRDSYINEIFTESLASNQELKIIVWNPELPNIPFEKNRFVHFNKPFDEQSITQFIELYSD